MISPGYHVFRGSDGTWRYATPDEQFVRITGPDHLLSQVSSPDGPADPGLAAALTERGVLTDAPPAREVGKESRVHLEGDGPVAEQLVPLLGAAVTLTRGPGDEDVVLGSDLLISCAGRLPDTRWRQVDAWLTERRRPWHRVHVEGNSLVLGPFSVPGATASYEDTRGRRLAASPTPGELADLWHHLDGSDLPTPIPAPAAAIAAGLLAADILAHLAGGTPPSIGHQLVLPFATLTPARHPVVPLPMLAQARR